LTVVDEDSADVDGADVDGEADVGGADCVAATRFLRDRGAAETATTVTKHNL
jgi:hypothetical protein